MSVCNQALHFLNRDAVILQGQVFRYAQILAKAETIAEHIKLHNLSSEGGAPPRVAFSAAPGPEYVASTWGVWKAGAIAVPLATSHPPQEISYVLKDSGVTHVLETKVPQDNIESAVKENAKLFSFLRWGANKSWTVDDPDTPKNTTNYDDTAGALMMYTSGTTGNPKGVLHTHRSITTQIASLGSAWEWSDRDRILHCLPLHHTHGIINALYCAHAYGACVEFLPKFSPTAVWKTLMEGNTTVFMGVPTMYAYMLSCFDGMTSPEKDKAREAASSLRVAISGSAACPLEIMKRWTELCGTPLLERYGMTETGMILSNPLKGDRRPGSVGSPLPGVSVKISNEDSNNNNTGELYVAGNGLFKEYWNRPQATEEAFDDGYFRTGDVVECDSGSGSYKILGRMSADIIKSGGYKISALHIENVVLEHSKVFECTVLGMPDDKLGEIILAIVVMDGPADHTPEMQEILSQHCRQKLPPYQVPKTFLLCNKIPRNVMGKINKKALRSDLLAGKFP